MSTANELLADEIIRIVQINRSAINGLDYGEVRFRVHQGHLVEITAGKTVKLTATYRLQFVPLKSENGEL